MESSLVVLVTGTRHVLSKKHKEIIYSELLHVKNSATEEVCLVHGSCSGVDEYCSQVAKEFGWSIVPFKADWSKGKRAGPERNQKMIDCSRPHVVLAFPAPDSRGTRDCVTRVRAYALSATSRLKSLKEILLN